MLIFPTIHIYFFYIDAPKNKDADIDIIVLSDSEEEDAASDNGSSIIQPIRQNKRPISAISSDSSMDLNSASSSINGPTSLPPERHTISNPAPHLETTDPSQSIYSQKGGEHLQAIRIVHEHQLLFFSSRRRKRLCAHDIVSLLHDVLTE